MLDKSCILYPVFCIEQRRKQGIRGRSGTAYKLFKMDRLNNPIGLFLTGIVAENYTKLKDLISFSKLRYQSRQNETKQKYCAIPDVQSNYAFDIEEDISFRKKKLGILGPKETTN